MAIRESIVFEVDASKATQGFEQMERSATSTAQAVANADAQVDALAASGSSLAASAKQQAEAISTVGSKAVQVTGQTAVATKQLSASTGEAGERISRLIGVFGGPELGAASSRLFAIEKGIQGVAAVTGAASTGFARFLGPLTIGLVAIEGITTAIDLLSSSMRKNAIVASDAAKADQAFIDAAKARIASLSGADRETAINKAIATVRAQVDALSSNAPRFDSLDALKKKIAEINTELERQQQIASQPRPSVISAAGGLAGLGADIATSQARARAAELEQERTNLTSGRVIAGGSEFASTAVLKALTESFPEFTKQVQEAEARAAPGLIRIADAFDLLDKAAQKTAGGQAARAVDDIIGAFDRQDRATLASSFALQAAIDKNSDLATALRETSKAATVQAAVEDLLTRAERDHLPVTNEQIEAVKRAAAAHFDLADALANQVKGLQDADAAKKASIETDKQSVAVAEREAKALADTEARRKAGAIAGGVGDIANALKNGDNPAVAAVQGISDRLFQGAVQSIEDAVTRSLAPLFGGTAGSFTPGEQGIISAVDRTTAAVVNAGQQTASAVSGKTAGVGGAAPAAGGFDFGALAGNLAIAGLGLGLSLLGGRGRSSGDQGGAGRPIAPFDRGTGAGAVYNQNRVTINNFDGAPERIRETARQSRRSVRGFFR